MVIIGSDHAGVELKNNIISYLNKNNIRYFDVNEEESSADDDYPDVAYKICKKVLQDNSSKAIAICGTGIGISIACNKIENIRAANCFNVYMAQMCRKHNDANVLCLGARLKLEDDVNDIINSFLNTNFEGGRHQRRIEKISNLEKHINEGGTSYGNSI